MTMFNKRKNVPTTYHENQFAVTFDPLTRTRSMASGVESTGELSNKQRSSRRKSRKPRESRDREHRSQSPMSFAFKNTMFTDKESRKIMRDVDLYHNKPMRLKKMLHEQAENVKRITRDKLVLSDETVSYSKLLDEMMFATETLVMDRGVSYRSLEFKDEKCETLLRPTMSEGRVFLSNTRLLFITADQLKGTILSTYGDALRGPGGYQVTSYHNDELHYQYIPLTCLKAIELHTRTGGKAEIELATQRPCSGICSWLGDILGMGFCMESWELSEDGAQGTEYNESILILSVLMPPFDTPMRVVMHVSSDVPLDSFVRFVSMMQQFAPEIAKLNGLPTITTEGLTGKIQLAKVKATKVPQAEAEEEEVDEDGERIQRSPRDGVYDMLGEQGPAGRRAHRQIVVDVNRAEMRERPLFYDPQRAEIYAALSDDDIRSVRHGTRVLPQVQFPGSRPAPVEVIYADDVAEKNRSSEKVARDLAKKRDSMVGRELPQPQPGPSGLAAGEGIHTLRSLRSLQSNDTTLNRSESTVPKYHAPTPEEREATLRHYKGARKNGETYVEAASVRKSKDDATLQIKSRRPRRVEESESEESDASLEAPLPPEERQKAEDEMDEIYATKHRVRKIFMAESIPEVPEGDRIEMRSTKSGTAGYTNDSRGSKPKSEKETDSDRQKGETDLREDPDETPEKSFHFTTTNPLTGKIRCVCARCCESVKEGTSWEPITNKEALELADGDEEKAKHLKKGYCVCAKCIESESLVAEYTRKKKIRDDVSVC